MGDKSVDEILKLEGEDNSFLGEYSLGVTDKRCSKSISLSLDSFNNLVVVVHFY